MTYPLIRLRLLKAFLDTLKCSQFTVAPVKCKIIFATLNCLGNFPQLDETYSKPFDGFILSAYAEFVGFFIKQLTDQSAFIH